LGIKSAASPPRPEQHAETVDVEFLDHGPEVMAALITGSTGFNEVALAYFFGRTPDEDDVNSGRVVSEENRRVLQDAFPVLLRDFVDQHGSLSGSYFAEHCRAAAVLTSEDEIEVVLARDVPCPDLVQIIRRAQGLAYSTWHRLEKYDRKLCQRMIFSVIVEVLRRLDKEHATAAVAPDSLDGTTQVDVAGFGVTAAQLAHLHRNLDEAEEFMLRCATRRAQSLYVRGMLRRGSLLVAPMCLAAALVGAVGGSFESILGQALLVFIAGATGALVSVMWRMTSGTFTINLPTLGQESGEGELRLMGAVRPALGGVFGLAVFVFSQSPLLPLEAGNGSGTFLLVALGFLAGFSERFAQDMFVRSGQGLAGPGGDSPSTGLSAGLAPPPGAPRGAHAPASTSR
jgi:hypothetical protein